MSAPGPEREEPTPDLAEESTPAATRSGAAGGDQGDSDLVVRHDPDDTAARHSEDDTADRPDERAEAKDDEPDRPKDGSSGQGEEGGPEHAWTVPEDLDYDAAFEALVARFSEEYQAHNPAGSSGADNPGENSGGRGSLAYHLDDAAGVAADPEADSRADSRATPEADPEPGRRPARSGAGSGPDQDDDTPGDTRPRPGDAGEQDGTDTSDEVLDEVLNGLLDSHFVPPEPPPLPRGDLQSMLAWVGVLGGPAVLLLAALVRGNLPGWLILLALGAFVGGFVVLIAKMPTDRDDGDDGAIV